MKAIQKLFNTCLSLATLLLGQAAYAETIDVLVLYVPETLETRNGKDIDARISSYITYANSAYENSQINLKLRLVGSKKVDLPYTYVTQENLESLRQNSEVAALRDELGADLVTLLNLRKSMSGGYVCGIGYIPGGDAQTGELYYYAPQAAYSLVGVECGASTFSHELGHNMGLGHSYMQNSTGGVWSWARGHGVSGLFSTIMAYPQSYGTYNQLPMFANPDLQECEGLACGVNENDHRGANAAKSLNLLSAQLSNFRPTKVEETNPPGEPTPDPNPIKVACPNKPVANNLLSNTHFDSLDGWRSGFGQSTLEIKTFELADCIESRLAVTDRSIFYSSAAYDFNPALQKGKSYQLNGAFSIGNASRENLSIALRVSTSWGSYFKYLSPVSLTNNEYTEISQNFSINDGQVVSVIFYGPGANVDILMDKVSVTPLN